MKKIIGVAAFLMVAGTAFAEQSYSVEVYCYTPEGNKVKEVVQVAASSLAEAKTEAINVFKRNNITVRDRKTNEVIRGCRDTPQVGQTKVR